MNARAPILDLFRDPGIVRSWRVAEWADTLPRLAQSGLVAHAAARVATAGVGRDDVPAGIRRQFTAASISSEAQLRSLRWEINEVVRALHGRGIRAVALKGADYLIRGMRAAQGRTVNDLDLLVARTDVPEAQAAFEAAGWDLSATPVIEGNHQLPLMTHGQRLTQLELHYQLVAEGGAVGFDIAAVLNEATPLRDGVLALLRPEDTTLVCVAHFVRNSRSISAFRDLLDLRELVEEFTSKDAGFGTTLIARAERVGLGAALSRAVRDSTKLFGDVASPGLAAWARRRKPSLGGGSAMALVPDGCTVPSFGVRLSRVGRMFARMRSAYPPGKTLQVGWQVLFGKDD
jgi:hypothetical protein